MEGRNGLSPSEEASLRREWARHEAVVRAIAEPRSQEGGIAARAGTRITAICKELGLDDPTMEIAHQVTLGRARRNAWVLQEGLNAHMRTKCYMVFGIPPHPAEVRLPCWQCYACE